MKYTLGSWITLGHTSIAEIMADAGFDWLCIDLEHSVIDYYDSQQMIAAIQSKGIPAFVRVGNNDPLIIKRVLDAGANGVIVPMVNNRQDALRAVAATKYPPVGRRGVGLARAQGYGFGFEKYASTVNRKIKIIAQIEHIEGIEHLAEILSVDGIDGTMIGPYDLSGSLGRPGKYDHPEVKKALVRYERVGKSFAKPIGYHVVQPDSNVVLKKIRKGYGFIAFGTDAIFLGSKARESLIAIRRFRP
jgi:2-keto-3-deoxy-L-rhamnonate aldolase RhmA